MCSGWCNNWVTWQHARYNNENNSNNNNNNVTVATTPTVATIHDVRMSIPSPISRLDADSDGAENRTTTADIWCHQWRQTKNLILHVDDRDFLTKRRPTTQVLAKESYRGGGGGKSWRRSMNPPPLAWNKNEIWKLIMQNSMLGALFATSHKYKVILTF